MQDRNKEVERIEDCHREEKKSVLEEKYCEYCGEVIYIGDRYYAHKGVRVCIDCSKSYAWAVFEEEARFTTARFDQLLDLELKDE